MGFLSKMSPAVPQVHLLICFDERVLPGVVLQSLDILRTKQWQHETVLICDESWKPYVNIDQAVIFVDKKVFEGVKAGQPATHSLELVLDQLDNFEIVEVTQIGKLNWGRWIVGYFDDDHNVKKNSINWDEKELSSIQVINDLTHELAIDPTSPSSGRIKSQAVFIDPYVENELCPSFLEMLDKIDAQYWPHWLQIIIHNKDKDKIKNASMDQHIVDISEHEISLFNQSILCFSENSPYCQTSRSYNVAVIGGKNSKALFLPGDISIQFSEPSHPLELFNILAYWKANRLRELAFQWLNMGIEIWFIESFLGRVASRNLLNYSADLFHAQNLVSEYLLKGNEIKNHEVKEMVHTLRREYNNDPYALSFSIKLLLMIIDRMIVSAGCGERLFQRLGSDYHRVIIGESLIEGLMKNNESDINNLDLPIELKNFKNFLTKVDVFNDQHDYPQKYRESR